jgi:hypothetical protein
MGDKGLRFNEGKDRYDLIPQFAEKQYAKVLTAGSIKYSENNWKMGMRWSKVIASLKRHTAKIESGEDYDEETGILHSAHIMCNAAFLTEYYNIYPQGDDRQLKHATMPRIGLDIDDCLADFWGAYCDYFDVVHKPKNLQDNIITKNVENILTSQLNVLDMLNNKYLLLSVDSIKELESKYDKKENKIAE